MPERNDRFTFERLSEARVRFVLTKGAELRRGIIYLKIIGWISPLIGFLIMIMEIIGVHRQYDGLSYRILVTESLQPVMLGIFTGVWSLWIHAHLERKAGRVQAGIDEDLFAAIDRFSHRLVPGNQGSLQE